MSMMEIRAKCRRLKQRHDLKLVIIDYLQLMSSGKRVESRQQEVSEFSRALKLLAKELEVPVIAISQLNRGSEQRTDKKPQMSDLRESGCLTGEHEGPARGHRRRGDARRAVRSRARATSRCGRWTTRCATSAAHLTHVFSTGRREVFRLRARVGQEGRGDRQPPVPHLRRVAAARRAGVGDRLGGAAARPAP